MTDTAAVAPTPPAFVRPGLNLTVACDRRLLELRVIERSRPDGGFAARAPRLLVREGLPVECRVFDEGCVWRMTYRIVRADIVALGEAEIQLELEAAERMGEERIAPRVAFKALATLRSVYFAPYEIGSFRVQTVELSRISLAFESERRIDVGQQYDVALDDGTGRTIVGRIEVARTESGNFGRIRAFARIVALDAADRALLEQLISRELLRPEVDLEEAPVGDVMALRDQLRRGRPGRLARLLGRA